MTIKVVLLGDNVIQNTNAKVALTQHSSTLRCSFTLYAYFFYHTCVHYFKKDCHQNVNLKLEKNYQSIHDQEEFVHYQDERHCIVRFNPYNNPRLRLFFTILQMSRLRFREIK